MKCDYLHVVLPDPALLQISTLCHVCSRPIWDGAHLTTFTLNGQTIGTSAYCPEHCNVCVAESREPAPNFVRSDVEPLDVGGAIK